MFQGKVIILTGARQVGKTSLSLKIIEKYREHDKKIKSFNCDNPTDLSLKWSKKKTRKPNKFLEYPGSSYQVISRGDLDGFVV